MLFQIGSGLVLAWRWSSWAAEPFRVFQVASGFYLSVFILGHMDSVFIFARTYLGIDTGWGFAAGAPTGILHDPWNIRLLPHYWLGVFFVLSHLASGLRVVLTAHGVRQATAVQVWNAGLIVSAAIATTILAGMCGLRFNALAKPMCLFHRLNKNKWRYCMSTKHLFPLLPSLRLPLLPHPSSPAP
jgi:hypothetical protein